MITSVSTVSIATLYVDIHSGTSFFVATKLVEVILGKSHLIQHVKKDIEEDQEGSG